MHKIFLMFLMFPSFLQAVHWAKITGGPHKNLIGKTIKLGQCARLAFSNKSNDEIEQIVTQWNITKDDDSFQATTLDGSSCWLRNAWVKDLTEEEKLDDPELNEKVGVQTGSSTLSNAPRWLIEELNLPKEEKSKDSPDPNEVITVQIDGMEITAARDLIEKMKEGL